MKANKYKLYFAHPILIRSLMREIELHIEEELNIELINPFYDTGRTDIESIDTDNTNLWKEELPSVEIVINDLTKIDESNGILAFLSRDVFTLGTIIEVWEGAMYMQKPIFIVTPNLYNHPWLKFIQAMRDNIEIFKDFDEFINHMKIKLQAKRRKDDSLS